MTLVPSRINTTVQRILRTSLGKRFSRFVLVAGAAVMASQITLTVCIGPLHMTAGKSAIAAWLAGAAVSYVLSRWAWERKGKPNLLRETVPFWIVALGTAVVLTLTTKYAHQQAYAMHLRHKVLFVDAAYFVANCVTFATRFVIFHYILFTDRGSKKLADAQASGDTRPSAPSAPDAFAASGAPFRAPSDAAPLPEPGSRR